MNLEQLQRLLDGHEWDDVEFKEAQTAVPDKIYRSVSAFSNTKGGWVVFGVAGGSVRTSRLVNFSACELHAVALGKEGYAHADAGLFRLPEAV